MKSIARWTILGALFAIPFLPLYVSTEMFFPFITSKGFAFRILVEIAAGAYLLLAVADKQYRPRWSWTMVLFGAFVAWMFVANLFAENPLKAFWSNYERMDGWVTLIHAFALFVIMGAVLSVEKLWKRWWLTVLSASVLVTLHGLWQIFGLATIHQGGARADANFGNAIYLAVYLMFTILVSLWQAIESKGWLRWTLVALAAVQVVILFATATRGVMLGLFGGLFVIAVAWAATSGGKARNIAVGAVIALVVLAGGFYLARDSAFIKNEPSLARLATVFNANELVVRSTLWGMAFQGVAERPITGWGQEGYNFVFNKYYQPSLYGQEQWFDRAHNGYIDWLVAGGFPAPLLFIALLIVAILALYRSKDSKATRLILAGALAAYAFQMVTAFDNLLSYILAAALFAMAHNASSKPIKAFEEAKEPEETTLATIGAPVALVVTVAMVWIVNVPGIDGSGTLIRAATIQDPAAGLTAFKSALSSGSFGTQEMREQLVTFAGNVTQNPNVPAQLKQEVLAFTYAEIEKQIEQVPGDARTHLMYAQARRFGGDVEGALEQMDIALTLSPKKQSIYQQRGTLQWQAGNTAAALKDFETAYALDTRSTQAATYVAAGRIVVGDVAGAKALLKETFGTEVIDHDIIRVAYFQTKRYDDLLQVMLVAVQEKPDDVQTKLQLVQAYALAGRMNEARAEAQAIVAAHPEASAAVASLLQQLGIK